jgi:hydroxymethylpyrimidine/phosphomethylpyrimidine kinase
MKLMQTALTIGVSDCSGGAGVQADLKVFTVLGVYGMAAVTAVLARNSGSRGMFPLEENVMLAQVEAIAAAFPVHAVKTGYLSTRMIGAVAGVLRAHGLDRYVCDPVIDLEAGVQQDAAAVHAYRQELLPLATVATPNRREAALLANMEAEETAQPAGARKAAEKILRTGCRAVVVKGISTADRVIDLFYDGSEFIEFGARRVKTKDTYGAGSLFSAIVAAMLAQEMELRTAVDHARSFVSQAIEHHVKFGSGARPVNVLALTPQ